MAIKAFRINKAVVVSPVASPTLTEQGEMAFDSTSDKLKVRNSASTDSVVQEANTATLTNKSIDADSNTITNIDNADIKSGAAIDASKIADGSVSSTEFQFINSLSSNAQTQLNSKITSGAASIVDADVNASAAIAATKIADGSVDNTEFQRLGAVTSAIVGLTDTQTLTNKTLTSPIMSSPSVSAGGLTLAEVASPSTPSSGNGIIYFKSDGFLYQKNDDGTETKVGAGAGGINYISANPDAESSVTGWAQKKSTTPGARPEASPGGSVDSDFTFTRSTSSPLRGTASFLITKTANNRQGNEWSFAFTLDSADKARMLAISFDYQVVSGTYDGGSSTTDSDLICYIRRTTATASTIEPAGFKILGGAIGTSMKQIATFQTDSDATGYELVIYQAKSGTSAYSLRLDNVSCGPQIVQYGAPVTDPQSYVPVITATTTNPTKGASPTVDIAYYWRVGAYGYIQYSYANANAGTAGSGTYLWSLPPGWTIDTTKITESAGAGTRGVVGAAAAADNSLPYMGYIRVHSATQLSLFVGDSTTVGGSVSSTLAPLSNTAARYSFTAIFPLVAASSSVVMSNDTDTRVISFRSGTSGAPTGTVASSFGSSTTIQFNSVTHDSAGAYVAATGYTVPVPGYYQVSTRQAVDHASIAVNQEVAILIAKNGSIVAAQTLVCANTSNLRYNPAVTDTRLYNAGDIITVRCTSTGTTPVTAADSTGNYLIVSRLTGPSAIAASESVNCSYHGATTTVGTTDTVAIMPTKRYDSHNAYNSSTGIFTVPVSGKYSVSGAALSSTSIAGALDNAFEMKVQKNSSSVGRLGYVVWQGSFTFQPVLGSGSYTIDCLAGDTLNVAVRRDSGITSFSLSASSVGTFITITRVGN